MHTAVALVTGLLLVLGLSTGVPNTQPRPVQSDAITLVATAVPQRAWDTLARIDAGTWPPNDGSGTKGGGTWQNRDGTLPRQDSAGKAISYKEWDVNIKLPGHNRDAERIVTGSIGSAWYTGDHYSTFTQMR